MKTLNRVFFSFQGIHNLQPVHSLSGLNNYMPAYSPAYSFIYPATSCHFIYFGNNCSFSSSNLQVSHRGFPPWVCRHPQDPRNYLLYTMRATQKSLLIDTLFSCSYFMGESRIFLSLTITWECYCLCLWGFSDLNMQSLAMN